MAEGAGGGPKRSDARRNRQAVIQAADRLFCADGLAVGMDDIATAAGLGVGTLYRHFPTKEALFSAVVCHQLEQLVALARRLVDAADPCAALFQFVGAMVEEGGTRKDLFEALARAGIDLASEAAELKTDLHDAVAALYQGAVSVGCVRADLSSDELLSLLAGTCMAAGQLGGDPAACARMAAVICDGLRCPDPARGTASNGTGGDEAAGAVRAAAGRRPRGS